jgi:hypothetical protein
LYELTLASTALTYVFAALTYVLRPKRIDFASNLVTCKEQSMQVSVIGLMAQVGSTHKVETDAGLRYNFVVMYDSIIMMCLKISCNSRFLVR